MNRQPEHGFALLLVLWTMVLLAFLAGGVMSAGHADTEIAFNLRANARAAAAADGELYRMVFDLIAQRGAASDRGAPWHRIRLARARGEVRIVTLSGRVNPNAASPQLLAALLEALGTAPARASEIAAAIVAWRTPITDRRAAEVLAQPYRAANRRYGPSGAPFVDVGQLRFVLGMGARLYRRLRPHLTLRHRGVPDAAFADPIVLQALLASGTPRLADAGNALVVAITVAVTEKAGGRFIRRAVVRIPFGPARQPFRILAWRAEAA